MFLFNIQFDFVTTWRPIKIYLLCTSRLTDFCKEMFQFMIEKYLSFVKKYLFCSRTAGSLMFVVVVVPQES